MRSFTDLVDITQKQANGVILGEYKMSLSDFIKSLSSSSTDGVRHETPILPNNCIKLVSTIRGYEVLIELPKRKIPVEYRKKQVTIGFPRMIFKYSIVGESIRSLKIVAVKDSGRINENTGVFYFPYSNVHHSSGEVCMGTNQFPKIDCLSQLDSVHYLFFAAPFGDDYGTMSLAGAGLSELFNKFIDREFDDDLLIPMNSTVKEFFNLNAE
ncbi:hypothetical protein NC797_07145 [Aquibacillus sp. 3ASR75-11]|uniref:PRTRC system protein B n=1 Tax=Terrihalobacillus insolitus TaxID=2950438 RepID=A0A9X4AN93_9BACI|nr:hypothetical protein [Terrihalobacillus insolitus]MDC3424283.1 hypothetical protein [Terrihalobacillus insolitus]